MDPSLPQPHLQYENKNTARPSEAFADGLAGRFAIAALLLASAFAVLHLGVAAQDVFTAHMLQHLVAMNVSAPLVALMLRRQRRVMALSVATVLQMAGLWFWHVPAIFASTHHSAAVNLLMQVSLFVTAVLFWQAICRVKNRPVWPRIFALLITAKLFCLLGAAFVFSRREIYPAFGNPEVWELTALEDQQLAGLIMVSSCAMVYVAAGITLFSIWLFGAKRSSAYVITYAAPPTR